MSYLKHSHARPSGFSLLEALIALLVISVGLLGIAGLQLKGMQHSTDAYMRTQASLLAQQIIDRMYANQGGLASYEDIECTPIDCRRGGVAFTSPGSGCNGADCTASELANLDATTWQTHVNNYLPGGRGRICHGVPTAPGAATCTNTGDTWVVTIMWDEDRDGDTGSACDPANQNDLQCYRVRFVPIPAT